MGSSGASGFKEMFIGSNTEKVVRTSKIPVLVIKNNHEQFNVTDFVFATDFSEEGRGALDKAQKFAKKLGAKIKIKNGYIYATATKGLKGKKDNIEVNTRNNRSTDSSSRAYTQMWRCDSVFWPLR